ncbi:hypothetical protein T484DRAFT_2886510 [Baffinella frigidus]|nr:hypothetical protein T484DRAFT_2886510 [Cryptophyta sp. CCMP2293]
MTSSPSYSREGAVVSGGIDPSQGLEISPRDYALFLESLLIERSVPSPRESLLAGAARLAFQDATTGVETFDRSKLPNTDLPGVFTKWHLSLGHWMECYWDDQEGRGTEWEGRCGNGMARRTLHSDVTGQGFYPVLSSPREPGGKQHFALVVAPPADATDTGDAIAKAIRTYRLIYSDIIALSKMCLPPPLPHRTWLPPLLPLSLSTPGHEFIFHTHSFALKVFRWLIVVHLRKIRTCSAWQELQFPSLLACFPGRVNFTRMNHHFTARS